jgi:hypothetical protein
MCLWGYHLHDTRGRDSMLDMVWEHSEYFYIKDILSGFWDYPTIWRASVRLNGGPPPEWHTLPAVVEAKIRGLL